MRVAFSSFAACAASLLVAGCVYDGAYRVRGTVRSATSAAPVAGARIDLAPVHWKNGASSSVFTTADGRFAAEYRFGGMMPFAFADGRPYVRVSAPDHGTCSFGVRNDTLPPGVSRTPCGDAASRDPYCFEFDVQLQSRAAPVDGACGQAAIP